MDKFKLDIFLRQLLNILLLNNDLFFVSITPPPPVEIILLPFKPLIPKSPKVRDVLN